MLFGDYYNASNNAASSLAASSKQQQQQSPFSARKQPQPFPAQVKTLPKPAQPRAPSSRGSSVESLNNNDRESSPESAKSRHTVVKPATEIQQTKSSLPIHNINYEAGISEMSLALPHKASYDSAMSKGRAGTGMMNESVHTQTGQDASNFYFPKRSMLQQWLMTDVIFIRHPRSILITTVILLCISIKLCVFGFICRLFDGCPYASGIWVGCLFAANSILGLIFVKLKPKRLFLLAFTIGCCLCLLLCIYLFVVTAVLLDVEEHSIREKGWNFMRQKIFDGNLIIQNTKLAMYIVHLVLAAIFGVCCTGTLILLCTNLSVPMSEDLEAYYISDSPFGHQTLLIPVCMRTGVDENAIKQSQKIAEYSAAPNSPSPRPRNRRSAGTQTLVTGRYM